MPHVLVQLLPKELIDAVHIDYGVAGGIYVPDGSKSLNFVHTCTCSSTLVNDLCSLR